MNPEVMSLNEARTERARLLRFRALSTADWQRVRRIDQRIRELEQIERRCRPLPIEEPVRAMRAQIAALQGA